MTTRRIVNLLPVLLCLAMVATGCKPAAPSQPPAPTSPPFTDTPAPTPTPRPTDTPEPTATATPIPTDTPIPTTTDTPTITPTLSPDAVTLLPGEPLRIGYLLWESNPIGVDAKRGIEIAIAEHGGKLLGRTIELAGFDEECNKLAGQRGAQILALDKTILAVLGTSCSASAYEAAPIISEKGKVLISPSNTSPELTAPDAHSPGYLRTIPSDIFQARAAAEFAFNKLGARRLALVYQERLLTQKLHGEFLCQVFKELGGECVLDRTFRGGETYMTPILNSIAEASADAVYFMGGGEKEVGAFFSEAKATPGLEKTAFFVWEGHFNPEFLRIAGENAVGVYVTALRLDFDRQSSAYQAFLSSYRSQYGQEPISQFHAYAYDAASILLKAIEQTAIQQADGSLVVDLQAIRAALFNLKDYPGLTGILTCTPLGECATNGTGNVFQFTGADPDTFNPGPASSLSSNPSQVWP